MPIYEYECRKCGALTEVFQKMNDKPPTKCGKCGGRLEDRFPLRRYSSKVGLVCDRLCRQRQASGQKADTEAAKADKKTDKKKESSPSKKTSEKASTTKSPSKD